MTKQIFSELSLKVSRNLGFLILPAGHWLFYKWSFYVLPHPPQQIQERTSWKFLPSEKKLVGWGGYVFGIDE